MEWKLEASVLQKALTMSSQQREEHISLKSFFLGSWLVQVSLIVFGSKTQ